MMKKTKKIPNSDVILIITTIIILVAFLGWMYKRHNSDRNKIEKNLAVVSGIILKGDNVSSVRVNYNVDEICYQHSFSSFGWCYDNIDCIGDSIKIEYNSNNPNIARLVRVNGELIYPSKRIGEQNYTIDCNDELVK